MQKSPFCSFNGVSQELNEMEIDSETTEKRKSIVTIDCNCPRCLHEKLRREQLKIWLLHEDPNLTGSNPENTVIIARLNYKTSGQRIFHEESNNHTEETLRNVCSTFGKIVDIRIIKNKVNGNPRGYAFVEFADQGSVERVSTY